MSNFSGREHVIFFIYFQSLVLFSVFCFICAAR